MTIIVLFLLTNNAISIEGVEMVHGPDRIGNCTEESV